AWTNRGNSYVALRKIPEAQRSYQKALDIDDSDALAQLGAAVCIARLGEWERGLEMMDQIDELRTSPLWMMERAQILVHLERWSEAVNLVNQAVEAAPDFPESWSMHGNVLELAGEYEEALASFQKALEYDSRHAAAWWGQVRMLARDEVNEAVVASLRSFFDCAGNDHEDYDAALQFAEKHGIPISGVS
ncbi:MAG: tetratricopeptide repeat protein, partial [Planctomycetota bacterium]|nr:tetratricopeptide repeat protein [Planctomycetota bacterium]